MATETVVAQCPDCKRKIELWPLLQVGEQLICPYCEVELEVVSLDPAELDWAHLPPADDDDWDYDWDDKDKDY